jgi:serine/threonine-protein kinase
MRAALATAAVLLALASAGAAQAQAMRPYTEPHFATRALVPAGWTLLPADPRWTGSRFVAPERNAWLAVYGSPRQGEGIEQHLRAVARDAGEEITYLRRGRGWLVASGYKGERIFYRKVVLACDGRVFHHIAFEYPAPMKRPYDRLVTTVSGSLASPGSACG